MCREIQQPHNRQSLHKLDQIDSCIFLRQTEDAVVRHLQSIGEKYAIDTTMCYESDGLAIMFALDRSDRPQNPMARCGKGLRVREEYFGWILHPSAVQLGIPRGDFVVCESLEVSEFQFAEILGDFQDGD